MAIAAPPALQANYQIQVFTPPDDIGPQVPLRFVLSCDQSIPTNLFLEYNWNQTGYQAVRTFATGSDDINVTFPAPIVGADYRLIWDAGTDLAAVAAPGGSNQVTLRLTAVAGAARRPVPAETTAFSVKMDPWPTAQQWSAQPLPPVVGLTGTMGVSQTGLAGRLFPELLSVKATDAQGNALPWVRMSFLEVPYVPFGHPLVAPPPFVPLLNIEADTAQPNWLVSQGTLSSASLAWATTDVNGVASVRVRAKAAVAGTARVEGRVVGAPDSPAVPFILTIKQPKITFDSPGPEFSSNVPVGFRTHYNSDGTPYTYGEFSDEMDRPVLLNVSTRNAMVPRVLNWDFTASEIIAVPDHPGIFWATAPPAPPAGVSNTEITVVVQDFANPSVSSKITWYIQSTTGPARQKPGWSPFNPLAYLEQVNLTFLPTDAGQKSQGGVSGVPLKTPFRLQLQGQTPLVENYHQKVVSGGSYGPASTQPGTVAVQTAPQTVTYQVFAPNGDPNAGMGIFSTVPQPGIARIKGLPTKPQSTFPGINIDQDVYFTPLGRGPWYIQARIDEPDKIFDPHAELLSWQNVSTSALGVTVSSTSYQYSDIIGGTGSWFSEFWFLVDAPEAVFVKSSGYAIGVAALDELTPGDIVRLRITATPGASNTTIQVDLQALCAGGDLPITSQGIPWSWQQTISLRQLPDGTFWSDELIIVSGGTTVARSSPLSPIPVYVVPGGFLRAHDGGDDVRSQSFSLLTRVHKRRYVRKTVGQAESLQETPVGTSPRGGAGGSVLLHNGELVLKSCDLSFRMRTGVMAFCRTWRGHVDCESPLGPGWSLGHEERLDVSTDGQFGQPVSGGTAIRWIRGSGIFFDFADGTWPSYGVAAELHKDYIIDNDHSPYSIVDAHQNVLHFNVDGSLRFVQDPKGNRITYTYNEAGNLSAITDPNGRAITLQYTTVVDPPFAVPGKFTPPAYIVVAGLQQSSAPPVFPPAGKVFVRLESITDFTGRTVNYQYYQPGETGGQVGWLKEILLPAAATLASAGPIRATGSSSVPPGGQPVNARRSVRYSYTAEGDLESVWVNATDGTAFLYQQSSPWVTNQYKNGRVSNQSYGRGAFQFDYTEAPPALPWPVPHAGPVPPLRLITKVTDRGKNPPDLCAFAASPYPEAAVPVLYQDPLANTSEFEHNADGNLTKLESPEGDGIEIVYDTKWASAVPTSGFATLYEYARQRGNVLTVRRKSSTGDERVWSFEYDYDKALNRNRYNLVSRAVGPLGNVPGANSEMYATHSTYDWQVQPGDPDLIPGNQGNLVRVQHARALHLAIGVDTTGNHKDIWIEDRPTHTFQYSPHGLVNWYKDPRGVITTYAYRPDTNPQTRSLSADEGWLLETLTYDTADNPRRQQYLPGFPPPAPMGAWNIQWKYDKLFHVEQFVDRGGKITYWETSDLHEIAWVDIPTDVTSTGPASQQPKSVTVDFAYNALGMHVQSSLRQPGATQSQGGQDPFAEAQTDAWGNVTDLYQVRTGGVLPVHSHIDHDENDLPIAYFSPDASLPPTAGAKPSTPNEGSGVLADARGFPKTLTFGFAQGGDPQQTEALETAASLQSNCEWTPRGALKKYSNPGPVKPWEPHQDGFGASYSTVDPRGNVARSLFDEAGVPSRSVVQLGEGGPNETNREALPDEAQAPVLGFSETRVDELGRIRRTHHGRFGALPIAGASATSVPPPVPDYFRRVIWPPSTGPLLADGKWGPGDGRVTTDTAYDVAGLITRTVDDEIGFKRIRRDAEGRPAQISSWSSASAPAMMRLVQNNYDPATGFPATAQSTESPTNAGAQAATYEAKFEHDDFGRVVRSIDGNGNAARREYDQTGHCYVTYDSAGPDSTEIYNGQTVNSDGVATAFERDGLGRLTGVLTKLQTLVNENSVSGQADARLTQLNTATTPGGTTIATGAVGLTFTYSDGGKLTGYASQGWPDPTTFGYDDMGRSNQVFYPISAAMPGSPRGTKVTTGGGSAGGHPAPIVSSFVPIMTPDPSLTMNYNPANGRVDSTTDANGTVLAYLYDDLDRVTGVTAQPGHGVSGSTLITFAYAGNVATATDGTTGRICGLTGDSTGEIVSENQGSELIKAEYDGNGNRTKLSYVGRNGAPVEIGYRYDSAGRLRSVTEQGLVIASFDYLGGSRVLTRTQGAIGIQCTFRPTDGSFVAMDVSGLTQGAIHYDLQRDRLGRIGKRTRTSSSVSQTKRWTYDAAGRIVIENRSDAAIPGPVTTTAETWRYYDADTVLLKQTVSINSAPPQTVDQKREERGRIVNSNGTTFLYDKNGNLTNDGSQTYVYDAWDRLVSVINGTATITYEYDALSRLSLRTFAPPAGSSATEEYIYDGWELILVRVNGSVEERYVYGDHLDDLLKVQIGDETYTVLQTPEGYIDGLADSQGNLKEAYDYTLAGQVTVLNGAGVPQPPGTRPLSRFVFQRRSFDFDAGIYWYRMRWYHPGIGQFLTPDPLAFVSGPNQYSLNHGDSVNSADPFGLFDWTNPWGTFGWKEKHSEFLLGEVKGLAKAAGAALGDLTLFAHDVVTANAAAIHDVFVPGNSWSTEWRPVSDLGKAVNHAGAWETVKTIVTQLPDRMEAVGTRTGQLIDQGKWEEAGDAFGQGFLFEAAGWIDLGASLAGKGEALLRETPREVPVPRVEPVTPARTMSPRLRRLSRQRGAVHMGIFDPTNLLKGLFKKGPMNKGRCVCGWAVKGTMSVFNKAAEIGKHLHQDSHSLHLPAQVRRMLGKTKFRFTQAGQWGADIAFRGGKHPSRYFRSGWEPGVKLADFKPYTQSGARSMVGEIFKWGEEPVVILPYDEFGNLLPKEGWITIYPDEWLFYLP